jgi:ribosomal protein S18 acetylase RimI-like enzyme
MIAGRDSVIVPLALSHCRTVARLHNLHMKDSVYGRFGEAFLVSCYTGMIQAGFGTGFVSLQDDAVTGFAFGRSTPSVSLWCVVMKQWRPLAMATATALVRRPALLFELIGHLLFSTHPRTPHGTAELLSIVVDPSQRGNSDAVQLAECLFDRFREDGCCRVRWETLQSNKRAQSFYKKLGGTVIERGSEKLTDAIWFEKELAGCKLVWHGKRIYSAIFSRPCPPDFVTHYARTAPSIWDGFDSQQRHIVDLAFEEDSDLEALEYACRFRGQKLLSQLFTLAVFLAEGNPEIHTTIINGEKRTLTAFAKLAYFALRSGWKLLKGSIQLRRFMACQQ